MFGAILMALGYLTLCFGGEAAKPFAMIDGQRYEVVQQGSGDDSAVLHRQWRAAPDQGQ